MNNRWVRRPSGLWTPEGIYSPVRFLQGTPSRRLGMLRTKAGVSSEVGAGVGSKAAANPANIAFVQSRYGGSDYWEVSVAYLSNVTAGSLLVAVVATTADVTLTVTCDSGAHTFTALTRLYDANIGTSQVFYYPNHGAGAVTVVALSSAGATLYLEVYEFSGIATTSPVNVVDYEVAISDQTPPITPHKDITTTVADTLLFTAVMDIGNNCGTYSDGSLISNSSCPVAGFGTGYQIVSTSGAKEVGLNCDASDLFHVTAVAFKAP